MQTAVLVASGFNYIGALADINIWNPRVEADDEYSSSMISLRNGEYVIECGWTVSFSSSASIVLFILK